MPLKDGVEISPDDAIKQDLCPECGTDLTKIHPRSHFATHWTGPIREDRSTVEARRRIKLCNDYLEAHPEPTAKE